MNSLVSSFEQFSVEQRAGLREVASSISLVLSRLERVESRLSAIEARIGGGQAEGLGGWFTSLPVSTLLLVQTCLQVASLIGSPIAAYIIIQEVEGHSWWVRAVGYVAALVISPSTALFLLSGMSIADAAAMIRRRLRRSPSNDIQLGGAGGGDGQIGRAHV